MNWQKIIFSLDEVADGKYEQLHHQISEATMRDPIRYKHVAIFMPRLAYSEKYDADRTRTAFFSPDAVKYFSALLQRYGSIACERPPRSEVGVMLSMGIDDEALFLE